MEKKLIRKVFFVSDGTGISVEAVGKSMLTQFSSFEFESETLRYINTKEQADFALERINAFSTEYAHRPIVFLTVVDQELRTTLNSANAFIMDIFGSFLGNLELELDTQASFSPGLTHALLDNINYSNRISALNFSLLYDDGTQLDGYDKADIILVGVSRSGKTPTSLYLALQHGVKTANFPITVDDIENGKLPDILLSERDKLFGLTISPERLETVRAERRPGSKYSEYMQCKYEVESVLKFYKKYHIPYLDASTLSVEELATKILQQQLSRNSPT